MLDILAEFGLKFLQAFLNVVLPSLAAVAAGFVIAWVKAKIKVATAELSESTLAIIQDAVHSAVLAAEQMNLVDKLDSKKDYALEQAANWLSAKGIQFDLGELSDLIEAAVMDEFNRDRVISVG